MHIGSLAVLVCVCIIPTAAYAQETMSADDRVFMFMPGESIQVIDVTEPNVPLNVATIQISSDHFTVTYLTVGDYLAAMGNDNVLYMVDVSAPYNPEVVSATSSPIGHPTLPDIRDVDWIKIQEQSFLFISTEDTIHVFDVSNPLDPIWLDGISNNDWLVHALSDIRDVESFLTQGKPYLLSVSADVAQIIEFNIDGSSVGTAAIWENQYGFESVSGLVDVDIVTSDGVVYAIILGNAALMVADITDPDHPVYVDIVNFNNTIDMDIVETDIARYALAMCIDKVHIVNLTDPLHPHYLSTAPIRTGDVLGSVSDEHLWAISVSDDIDAVDITDAASPIPAYIKPGGNSYQPEVVQTAIIDGSLYSLTASPTRNDIQIVDITDPQRPMPVSAIEGGGTVYGMIHGPSDIAIVEVDDHTYAVVTNVYDSSITIIDVSAPKLPTIKSNIELPVLDAPTSVATVQVGSSLYAVVTGFYSEGIRLIDITDISSPQLGTLIRDDQYGFEIEHPLQLDAATINGLPYVLVANYYEDAIQIIDITDPDFPVSASTFSSEGMTSLHDIVTTQIGSHTFAVTTSSYDHTVTIVDVSDPHSPTLASQVSRTDTGFEYLDTPQYLDVVHFGESVLVVVPSYFDESVTLIDITDPHSPTASFAALNGRDGFEALIGPTDISAVSYGSDAYIVVASYFGNGIQIGEITDIHRLVGHSTISAGFEYSLPLSATSGISTITIANATYALTATSSSDVVQVTDVSSPQEPVFVSLIHHNAHDFVLDGPVGIETATISDTPYAFILGFLSDTVQVVDLSDPYEPISAHQIRDDIDFPIEAELVWIDEIPYLVLVSRSDDTVQIFDVSDPTDTVLVANIPDLLRAVQGLDIIDTPDGIFAVLYSFSPNIMHVIDITNPFVPDLVATVRDAPYLDKVTGMDSIVVGDQTLMAISGYRADSLSILDMTDVRDPRLLSIVQGAENGHYLHAPESLAVGIIGDGIFAVVANGNDSTQITDITDPTNPVIATPAGVLNGRVMYGTTDVDIVTIGSGTYILFQTLDENLTVLLDATDPYGASSASFIPPLHNLHP